MNDRLRVAVIEDQWMIRDGLAELANVAEDIEVVATGSDGLEALTIADEFVPNVILMDIKMPKLDGLEATRKLKVAHPQINVLILTTFTEDNLIADALSAGATGYLTKDIAAQDLASAIRTAAKGLVQLTPDVAASLTANSSAHATSYDMSLRSSISRLTPREQDVLRLLATGASNTEIADELHLSAGTVKNHVSSILRELGLSDRTKAALFAQRLDIR